MRAEWWLVLLLTAGCATMKPPARRGASLQKLPSPKTQKNPVGSYPDPNVASRFRGLHFLGEGMTGNLEFLTQVENATEETRTFQTVRLELFPDRATVGVTEGVPLEAPEPTVPFTLKSLWEANDGGLWFSDGVAPGLFRYEKSGTADKRLVALGSGLGGEEKLPSAFKDYSIGPVLGFEKSLYLFGERAIGDKAPWARVIEWEPGIGLVKRAFFYPLDSKDSTVAGAVALNLNRFLIAEQTGDKSYRVYRVDSSTATDISPLHWMQAPGSPSYWDGLPAVRTARKTPLFDLAGEGELDGFALVDYSTVVALRWTEQGTDLWLQRLAGGAITSKSPVDNPSVLPEMTKQWRPPAVETL